MAKEQNTLQKAMHSLNIIEVYYAKMICKMSNGARLKIYRKIASLMSNRFSLMNALDRLHDSVSNGGKIQMNLWPLLLQVGLEHCKTVFRSLMP